MANTSVDYETFFSNSLDQKQTLLQKLQEISPQDPNNTTTQHMNLIDQVFNHYMLYYQEKQNAAREDPFLFLNPPWLTSFEKTLLWLGDFKPSFIFTFISSSVKDLTAEQSEGMERLKAVTRRDERHLTEIMAEIQERVAAQPIYSMARRAYRRHIDGEITRMEEAVDALKEATLAILERADALRISTAANVVEILSPVQGIGFFTAAIDFQLRARTWGQLRDLENKIGVN